MKTKTIIIIVVVVALAAGIAWYASKGNLMSTEKKRQALMGLLTEREVMNGDNFNMLSAAEVDTAYDYVFNYVRQSKTPPADLAGKVNQLTAKYGIFG